MPNVWDDNEKRALTRAVKFILDDYGMVANDDLEKIAGKAAEVGFHDFREVFETVDDAVLTDDEFEGFLDQVGCKKRKFDILRLAIEITEARTPYDPGEVRFARTLGDPVRP